MGESTEYGEGNKSSDLVSRADLWNPPLFVDDFYLKSLDVRPSLTEYIRQLWQRRFFIVAEGRAKAFQSSRDLILGKFWLIADPLLNAAMYGLIFGLLFGTRRGIDNFPGYVILGMAFFGIAQGGISAGVGLIRSNKNMIQAFKFPRAAVVLSMAYRRLLDSLPVAVVMVLAALVTQWGTPIRWTLVLVIPVFLLIHLFAVGLTFLAARLTAFVPDAKVLLNLFTRAWFYISGVFFTMDRFEHYPELQAVMQANPGYLYLDSVRQVVMYGNPMEAARWGELTAWAVGTALVGFIYFWRAEERYGAVQ